MKSNTCNKIILFLAITVISVDAFAQKSKLPVDETTKLITYTGVKQLPGVKSDSLYRKALAWCNTYFLNPADVIREQDPKEGKIVCKARFKISNPPDKNGFSTDGGNVQYTLTLSFRDGRYKYDMTAFNWKQLSYYPVEKWMDTSNQYYKPEFEHYLMQVDEKSNEIIKEIEKAMVEKVPVKKDNW